MYKELLELSIEVSKEAGKILLKGFRSKKTVISYKSRTDLVTNIDKESEEFLYNEINKRFSQHTIIAEEGSRNEKEHDLIWYIDPLDATNNFAHGLPLFCISIGVFSKSLNRAVSGVIYNPYLNELFYGSYKNGSFLNDEKLEVSEISDPGISMIATGFPYDKENPLKNNLSNFNRILPQIQGIRRMGSAAIDLAYVAAGRVDGFWEPELKPWDVTAGAVIVEEAGGKVTTYNGDTFNPETPQIVASNTLIHNWLIDQLSE